MGSELAKYFVKGEREKATRKGLSQQANHWCCEICKKPVKLEPRYDEFDPDKKTDPKSPKFISGYERVARHYFSLKLPDRDLFSTLLSFYSSLSQFQDHIFSYEIYSINGSISVSLSIPKSISSSEFREMVLSFVPDAHLQLIPNPLSFLSKTRASLAFFDITMPPPYYGKLYSSDEYSQYPLRALLSCFSQAKKAVYQVLLQPIPGEWAAYIQRLIHSGTYLKQHNPDPMRTITPMKKMYENLPLLAVCVRILCNKKLEFFIKSFLGNYNWNGAALRWRSYDAYKGFTPKKIKKMFIERLSYSTGILMNSQEVAQLTTLPENSAQWTETASLPIPAELSSPGRPLGIHHYFKKKVVINLPDSSSNLHSYLIGRSKYGKSTTLKNNILHHIINGDGVIYLDPHGDDSLALLGLVPEEYCDRVIYFTPTAGDDLVPAYNLFDAVDERDYGRLTSDLLDTFQRMFGSGLGHRAIHLLGKTFYALFVLGRNLSSLPLLLGSTSEGNRLRSEVLRKSSNEEIRRFYTEEFQTYKANEVAPVLNKVSNIFLDNQVRRMFSVRRNRFDIKNIMDNGKALICNLSVGIIGNDIASLIGAILIAQIQKYALRRASIQPEDRKRCFVFIDEFHRFPSLYGGILDSYISELRKYRCYCALANQNLAQLNDAMQKSALSIENILVYNSDPKNSKELAQILGEPVTASDITALGVGEAIVRIGQAPAIKVKLHPPQKPNMETIAKIKEMSYSKYYVTKEDLKHVVRKTYGLD